MIRFPMLWGACLACALGGALAGNALGSTQISDRSALEAIYQSHDTAYSNRQDGPMLPDHYPLKTRSGVVPVALLSERGLFSQSRYRTDLQSARDAADHPGEPNPDPGPDLRSLEQVEVASIPEPIAPLALSLGPVEVPGQGKVIKVHAALAMR